MTVEEPQPPSADELSLAVQRLLGYVAHWTPERWAAPGRSGVARVETVHELVQRIADLAARAEGVPCRPVPRLDNDLALCDQLRVVVSDLLAAGPPPDVRAAAVGAVTRVHRGLSPDTAQP